MNPNGSTTTAWFQWGTTTSYGNTTTSQSVGSGSTAVAVSQAISGLTCGTTYHFRVVAQNAGGTSYGGDQSFTTSACPDFSISLSPTTITVYRCGAEGLGTVTTTISGGFNSAITLSRSGVPSGVSISFSPNPIAAPGSGSSQLDVTPLANAATGTFTVTVTGSGGGQTHSVPLTLIVKPSISCLGPVVLPTPTPTPTPTTGR